VEVLYHECSVKVYCDPCHRPLVRDWSIVHQRRRAEHYISLKRTLKEQE
jgi:hypothetical protein